MTTSQCLHRLMFQLLGGMLVLKSAMLVLEVLCLEVAVKNLYLLRFMIIQVAYYKLPFQGS